MVINKSIACMVLMFVYISILASDGDSECDVRKIMHIKGGSLFVMDQPLFYYIMDDQYGVGAHVGVSHVNEDRAAVGGSDEKLVRSYLNPYVHETCKTIPLQEILFKREGEQIVIQANQKLFSLRCTNKYYCKEKFTPRIKRLLQQFIEVPHCVRQDVPRLIASKVIIIDNKTGKIVHGPGGTNMMCGLLKK